MQIFKQQFSKINKLNQQMSAIENINPRIRVETIKSNEVSYSRIKDTSTSSIIVIPYTISKIGESTAKIEEIFVRDHKNAFTNKKRDHYLCYQLRRLRK